MVYIFKFDEEPILILVLDFHYSRFVRLKFKENLINVSMNHVQILLFKQLEAVIEVGGILSSEVFIRDFQEKVIKNIRRPEKQLSKLDG